MSKNLQSQGLDINEQLVKEFNVFLFGKIRQMQADFLHLEIFVPKLGFWKIRRTKLDKLISVISNLDNSIRAMAKDEESAESAVDKYRARLERMKELSARHEQMIQTKRLFKQKVNELKSIKGGIQEPQQDMGRPQEQTMEAGTYRDNSSGETGDL